MKSKSPTVLLTVAELQTLIATYHAAYDAATKEQAEYDHAAYEAAKSTWRSTLRRLVGVRTDEAYWKVDEAFFDNSPCDAVGALAALTLTGHNVVLDNHVWLPAGANHYVIRRAITA